MDLANDFVSQFVKGLDNFLLIEAAGEFIDSVSGRRAPAQGLSKSVSDP
jgi:hypothetical protein